MKNIFFLFLLICTNGFSQTILIEPNQISKSKTTNSPNDITLRSIFRSADFISQHKSLIPAADKTFLSIKASGFDGASFNTIGSAEIRFKSISISDKSDLAGTAIEFFTTKNNEAARSIKPLAMAIKPYGYLQIGGIESNQKPINLDITETVVGESAGIKLENITHLGSSTYLFQNYGGHLYNLGGTGLNFNIEGSVGLNSKEFRINDINNVTHFLETEDGNFGIGQNVVPNANTRLKVSSGPSGFNIASATAIFEDDVSHYIGIYAPNGYETGLMFGKPTLGPKSGGIVYSATENMEFKTGGNLTRMTIAKLGNVGIGVLPVAKFHISNGISGLSSPIITSDRPMVIEAGNNNQIVLASPNANSASLIFKRPNGSSSIEYDSNGNLNFISAPGKQIITSTGNVGIGIFANSSPTAKLHIDGDFALKKTKLLAGSITHNNLDRAGSSIIKVGNPGSGGGNESISGFANGVDGLIIHVYPRQGTSLILLHDNSQSSAGNRILTHTAANITLINNGGATLIYDSSVNSWRLISIAN